MRLSDTLSAIAVSALMGALIGFAVAIFIVPARWEMAQQPLPAPATYGLAAPVITSSLSPWGVSQ